MSGQVRTKERVRMDTLTVLDLLSHDLGNSVQEALAKLEMMEIGTSGGRVSPDDIGRDISSMHRMVQNVRSAVQAIQLPYRPETIDIFKVIQSAREKVSRYFGSAPIVDIISSEPDLSVTADRLLYEAVAELMLNSMEHSGKGTCRISIGYDRSPERVRITYEDTSDRVDLSRIERSMGRLGRMFDGKDHNGSGTGLSMVQAIIDRYGGTIKVEHRKKGLHPSGSRFIIDLPG